MARYIGPKRKLLVRFGMAESEKSHRRRQKRRTRKTEYGVRLEEKQRLKFTYGILERQLRKYARLALSSAGDPGEQLMRQLETRLDNVVYRLGFAVTRGHARQLVNHGHVLVNGRKVDIPSYAVRKEETIVLKDSMQNNPMVQTSLEQIKPDALPPWLTRKDHQGTVLRTPEDEELMRDFNAVIVLDFYK